MNTSKAVYNKLTMFYERPMVTKQVPKTNWSIIKSDEPKRKGNHYRLYQNIVDKSKVNNYTLNTSIKYSRVALAGHSSTLLGIVRNAVIEIGTARVNGIFTEKGKRFGRYGKQEVIYLSNDTWSII